MKRIICLMMCLGLFAQASELRVVSYNIHHGVGMDGKLDLERIADVILQQNPDVVALQEVDNMATRSGSVDQAAVLAKLLGMQSVFGKCINLGEGGYGNAILSKHPIVETRVHRLPGGGEPRVALEVVAKVDGELLSIVSVHFEWSTEAIRLKQANALEGIFSEHAQPVIVLGDFNARPESETMQLLRKTWSLIPKTGAQLTSPADVPRSEIDYILTRNLKVRGTSCFVMEEAVASDHRPLAGVIRLKEE